MRMSGLRDAKKILEYGFGGESEEEQKIKGNLR